MLFDSSRDADLGGSPENRPLSSQSAAESGAVDAPRDTRRQRLLDGWDEWPESV